MTWATSKEYIKLVGEEDGWVAVPPGTRKSTYDNPEYQKAAPFAKLVSNRSSNADITKPTKEPVPYSGIQYVAIPEFQGIGTVVASRSPRPWPARRRSTRRSRRRSARPSGP